MSLTRKLLDRSGPRRENGRDSRQHTHRAIDDARGFANVLAKLFAMSGALEKHEATESVYR